jgi:zeaxanthin glucosyltransferase
MAEIVFVARGMMSPLNASLALCRRLQSAGHQITYVSHDDIDDVVGANGFSFVRLEEDRSIRDDAMAESRRNPVKWLRTMRSARNRSARLDEIERVIGALNPDLLIIDIEMHYAIIATASLRIPTVLAMNWFSVYRRPGFPPPGSRNIPDQTIGGKRAAQSEWRAVRLRGLGARARHKIGRGGIGDLLRPIGYGTYHYADLKAVARARGYPLRDETDRRQWLRPYTYTRYPVVCFNALEMELPHVPPPNLEYVGPMVDLQRVEPRVTGEALARWETVRKHRLSEASGRPLVYCTLGSYWADLAFLRMIVDTFTRRSEWDLILGLGRQTSRADFGHLPENVTVLEWAPQLEVLALADVAINHAGVTSVNEAISLGVPIIAYSPDLTDQDGVAARIAYHGLGVAAEWDTKDPARLEQHIEHVLDHEPYQLNVQAMREAFRRYESDRVAEVAIERFLGTDGAGR